MSVSLESVVRLVEDFESFDEMEGNRKGAFRARVTRYLKQVEDDEIREILESIQEQIGESERPSAKKLTPEDMIEEFPKFRSYNNRRRGAYKAKLTRLLNEARESGDTADIATLESLQSRVDNLETEEQKAKIRRMFRQIQETADEEEE